MQFQGKSIPKQQLKDVLSGTFTCVESTGDTAKMNRREINQAKGHIFIVHGHDTESRNQLELALRRLGVELFILMNSSGGGKTLIEALEGHIGKDYSSDFGIVLMTPDDMGYAKKDGEGKIESRARPECDIRNWNAFILTNTQTYGPHCERTC